MEEESKAIKAIAKATEKGINAARDVGGFLAKFISGPLEQGIGIFEDKLKYLRWERQIRLINRANDFLNEQGLTQTTRPVPLKLAIPLFQQGSLEEDNDLQDLWAILLVNASDARNDFIVRSAFISTLKDLSSLDALMLQKIYSISSAELHQDILTFDLPQNAFLEIPEEKKKNTPAAKSGMLPTEEAQISLGNLTRLGLVTSPSSWGGFPIQNKVHRTLFGLEFHKACTLKKY